MPIPLPLLHTLRSAGGDGKRHFESREVFLSAAENSCGFGFRLSEGATTLTLNEYPKTFSTSRSTKRRRRYRRRRREPKDDEDDAARGGSKGAAFFFVFRLAARRAPRVASVGHVVDEDTHKFGFPQISRDREDCETTDTLGARADAARDARFVFVFSSRVLPSRDALGSKKKKTRIETTSSSPVMKLQKGVSQKHHSQCPNFRVILPDSSGCPVEN